MAKFLKSAVYAHDYPLTNREVVFIGRSNVGKSSLINALYGNIALVGKNPGKTKFLNFFDIDKKYTICDVPGYGFANRSKEEIVTFGKMMEEYFAKRDKLRLCIMIIDVRHQATNDDIDMLAYLKEYNIPYVIVANKIDKLSNNQLFNAKRLLFKQLEIDDKQMIFVSAEKKLNIEILRNYIESQL